MPGRKILSVLLKNMFHHSGQGGVLHIDEGVLRAAYLDVKPDEMQRLFRVSVMPEFDQTVLKSHYASFSNLYKQVMNKEISQDMFLEQSERYVSECARDILFYRAECLAQGYTSQQSREKLDKTLFDVQEDLFNNLPVSADEQMEIYYWRDFVERLTGELNANVALYNKAFGVKNASPNDNLSDTLANNNFPTGMH